MQSSTPTSHPSSRSNGPAVDAATAADSSMPPVLASSPAVVVVPAATTSSTTSTASAATTSTTTTAATETAATPSAQPTTAQPPSEAVPAVADAAAAAADQPHLFAGLRSTMERSAQNWRSNFTNVVLRPLVQHRVQQQHNHQHPHHNHSPLQQQQQLQLQHPLHGSQSSGSAAAAAAANNLLQHWMPIGTARHASSSSSPVHSPSATVVINLDGGGGGSSSGGQQQATGNNALFQPAGGYSLIDVQRLQATVNGGSSAQPDASGAQQTGASPASETANERPTQFDSRRAQILADLQNELPQPNPATGSNGGGGAGGGGGGGGGPTPDIFVQIPEARQLVDSLMRYLPYVFILAFKYMIDHMDGILNVALLVIMFSHANWMVKKQIARQKQRSVFALLRELAYVTVVLLFVGVMIGGEWTWMEWWVGADGKAQSEWPLRKLLYNVLVTDMVAKLVTVHVKIGVTLLPPCVVNYRNRGRIYLFIEGMSQLVRSLLPVLPWMVYLLNGYTGYDKVFGVILSATYIVAKGNDLMRTTSLAKDGVMELFKIVRIGANPTKEELQAAGDQCPICHDTYTDPLRLSCTHIFCEACVATWFDREPTCPLCRALVGDDPSWRDGATSHFIQFY